MMGFSFRAVRKCALILFGVSTALFISCGSDSADERAKLAKLAEGCLIDSDCATPLVCAFKSCHTRCNDSRDCPDDQVCVTVGDSPHSVCLHTPDKCIRNSECPADHLICAKDERCRVQCVSTKDCPPEQKCVSYTCADDKHLTDGELVPPGGPNPDASVGTLCLRNSDCDAPLVCLGGACLPECIEDRDCTAGRLCSTSGTCVFPGQGDAGDGGVVVPSCVNGKQDQNETGIDCGGGCGNCDGDPCSKPLDCASNVCQGLVCQAPTCGDGLQNGVESDVDCGGGCPKCPPTKGCWTSNDCTTGSCVGGSCNAPGCSNGSKDTNETDVDCGGTECKPCATGKGCEKNTDCSSQNCVGKKCVKAGPTLWTRVINGSSWDTVTVRAAGAGHVIMAGEFTKGSPGINLGGGALISSGKAFYFAKHTAAGAHSWSRSVALSTFSKFGGFTVDPKGDVWLWANAKQAAVLPGGKPSCVSHLGKWVGVLAKLNGSTGADEWSACPGAATTGAVTPFAVAADAQGDLWVSATFTGTIDLDLTQITTPYTNGFLAKYSGVTGSLIWANHIKDDSAPPGSLYAFGNVTVIASDATHTYAAGVFTSKVKIGTGSSPVWLTKTGASDDIFIVKMDATGKVVESRVIGGAGKDTPIRAVVSGGELWLAGEFEGQLSFSGSHIVTTKGGRDVFVARFSLTDLSTLDAMNFGASTDEDLGGFDVSANGEFAITGTIRSAHNFGGGPLTWVGGDDFFLARFSKTGVHQDSWIEGGTSIEHGLSAAYLGQSLYVGGQYGSTYNIDFGNGPLPTPPASVDAFVVFFP